MRPDIVEHREQRAKFTGCGGKIDIALSTEDDMLRVDMSDTGQGINASFLPHVVDMFRQQPGPRARGKGGLGIGLALVKQLIDMHGGRITARSDGPAKGACISVWFPRVEESHTVIEASKSVLAMNGLRVLIVDDYHETGASFAALLNLEGAIPSVAHSALDALTLLKSNAYDVLISDLDMSGMDGYAFIRQVRGGSKRAQIRAIAASGYNREEDKRRVMEAGFDALVEKPVSLEALVAAVNG